MNRINFLIVPGCLFLAVSASAWDQNEDLLAAARKGDLDAVQSFVAKGAAIEAKTPYGQTPLYLAAMSGHTKVVEYLLGKGANVDVKDTFYKAPLTAFVLQRKHYDVAKLLIATGKLDMDEVITGVVGTGRTELVTAALATGKVKPESLSKALGIAQDEKKQEIAELLVKAGAKPPDPGVAVEAKMLESYAGSYKSAALPLEIKVSPRDGKLVMQATGQPEFGLKAKSEKLFANEAFRIEIEFKDADSFALRQGGQSYDFKKAGAQ